MLTSSLSVQGHPVDPSACQRMMVADVGCRGPKDVCRASECRFIHRAPTNAFPFITPVNDIRLFVRPFLGWLPASPCRSCSVCSSWANPRHVAMTTEGEWQVYRHKGYDAGDGFLDGYRIHLYHCAMFQVEHSIGWFWGNDPRADHF